MLTAGNVGHRDLEGRVTQGHIGRTGTQHCLDTEATDGPARAPVVILLSSPVGTSSIHLRFGQQLPLCFHLSHELLSFPK